MKLVTALLVFLFVQLPAYADLGGYLGSRITISSISGPWETDALMVIQIGTFRGEKSTQIDSIVIKNNGDLILIRDQLEKISDTSAEWRATREAIKRIEPLDNRELTILTEIAHIETSQNKIKDKNASSISSVKRFMHIYKPPNNWAAYDLVSFPALENNSKTYDEWEKNFGAVFSPLSKTLK